MRRFAGLVRALPTDSALVRRLDEGRVAWSTTDELLAITAERVGVLGILLIRLLASKPPPASSLPDMTLARPYDDGAPSSSPSRSHSPSATHRPRRPATKEELRRFMGKRIRYTPREG